MQISNSVEEEWKRLETIVTGLHPIRQPSKLHKGIPDKIHNIPQKPGIYAIFRKNGKCFYVGSSTKNIRERLMIHYKGDVAKDWKDKFNQLKYPEKFRFWFFTPSRPKNLRPKRFNYLIITMEALLSSAWNPTVPSVKF